MLRCEDNPFCRCLTESARSRLCEGCVKCTYAAGTSLPAEYRKPYLVLEGMVLIECDDKPASILIPGNISTSIEFTPKRYLEIIESERNAVEQYANSNQLFLANTTYAMFPNQLFHELMDDNSFLRTLYDFDISQLNQQLVYQRYIYQKPIDDTLRYILSLMKKYGVSNLTHKTLAQMVGRSRPTITQSLGRLTISDPSLFEA